MTDYFISILGLDKIVFNSGRNRLSICSWMLAHRIQDVQWQLLWRRPLDTPILKLTFHYVDGAFGPTEEPSEILSLWSRILIQIMCTNSVAISRKTNTFPLQNPIF